MEAHRRTMDHSFTGPLHNPAHTYYVLDFRLNLQSSNQRQSKVSGASRRVLLEPQRCRLQEEVQRPPKGPNGDVLGDVFQWRSRF